MNQRIIDSVIAPKSHLGARVLVVDDDPFAREFHALMLRKTGIEVVTTTNGIEALERLADEPFDLLLTDRRMPGLDGASVIMALRSAGSQMPVVMVSASLAETPLSPAIRSLVSAAIPKPASAMEVISAVREALHFESQPEIGGTSVLI